MKRRAAVVMAAMMCMACCLAATPAWAARTSIHDAAESPEYGRKFGGMIGRGLINVTTCFVDLLVNVVNETRTGPPVVGTLVGVAKGAGCTTLRALSGVVDVATFWVPGFNGVPVSDSYDHCMAVAGMSASASGEHEMAMPEGESSWGDATSAPAKEAKPRYTK